VHVIILRIAITMALSALGLLGSHGAFGASSGQSAVPSVSFAIGGGDTWMFERSVAGSMHGSGCDLLLVRSPAGSFRAEQRAGRFFATVRFRSGRNSIRASCFRNGELIARSPTQTWIVKAPDRPRARIRARVENHAVLLDAGGSEPAPGTPVPIATYRWNSSPNDPAVLALGSGRKIEIPQPVIDGIFHVSVRVTDALGRSDESSVVFRVRNSEALGIDADGDSPDWLDTAVVYGIALPSVAPPVFENVQRHLDAIVSAGANAIWLSPVTEAPPRDFGYAVTDHFVLRASLGTSDELRALIAAAHSRKMKVFMDMAVNHLSSQHRYFAAVERDGARSAYFDWFDRDPMGAVTHYFDWQQLENLNYDNPDVRAYVTAAFVHWARDFAVDGFRVDAAWTVRQRAAEFWPQVSRELRRINPELVLIAEASARDPYYAAHGFDAAYDWTGELGEWAWAKAFASPRVPQLAELRAALTKSDVHESGVIRIFRFLNNNDTGARFLTRHGSQETLSAMALLFTIPGLPSVYLADEQGAEFEPYRSATPVSWPTSGGVFTSIYRRLAEVRRIEPALHSRELRMVRTDHDDFVLAFLRPGTCAAHGILVLLNFADWAGEVRLRDALPSSCQQPGDATQGRGASEDLLTGRRLALEPRLPVVHLDAFQNLILRLD
jgi:cyclomaltodextrinase